jgi:hypothetical protein
VDAGGPLRRDHPLHPLLSRSDHEGFELRIPTVPLFRRSTQVIGTLLAIAAPVTVLLLALPGAAYVEAQGWWLVNEDVLIRRWLIAVLTGAGLAFLTWLATHPSSQRLRLTARTLTLQRFFRRPATIRLAEVVEVTCDEVGVRLHHAEGSRRIDLPGLTAWELAALVDEIRTRAEAAQRSHGSKDAVPQSLHQMRAPRTPASAGRQEDVG